MDQLDEEASLIEIVDKYQKEIFPAMQRKIEELEDELAPFCSFCLRGDEET